MNQTLPPLSAPPKPAAVRFGRRLRYYLEAAAFFSVIGFFKLFRIDTASAIGGWIGRNLLAPTPLSRRALANLSLAYPEKSAAEIKAILLEMWDNLGRVIAEYAHLDHIHWKVAHPRLEVVNQEYGIAALESGKGVIMIGGHFANWEVMPIAARDYGIVGGTVVRPTNNPYVNRWLERARSKNGLAELIPKSVQGTKRIFTLLRKGDAVMMLVDQRASEGILAPFFGKPAQTTAAPASLALKLGCIVLPGWNERIGGARFRITLYPPIPLPNTGDQDSDLVELTTAINSFIEARVRERPGQWLWLHRRWVGENAPLRKRAQALSPARGGTSNATSKRV